MGEEEEVEEEEEEEKVEEEEGEEKQERWQREAERGPGPGVIQVARTGCDEEAQDEEAAATMADNGCRFEREKRARGAPGDRWRRRATASFWPRKRKFNGREEEGELEERQRRRSSALNKVMKTCSSG